MTRPGAPCRCGWRRVVRASGTPRPQGSGAGTGLPGLSLGGRRRAHDSSHRVVNFQFCKWRHYDLPPPSLPCEVRLQELGDGTQRVTHLLYLSSYLQM